MSPIRLKQCSGKCGQSYPISQFWADAGAPDGHMSRCPNCERAARRERAEAKARGELEPGKPDRNGRMVTFTDEERKRRSELAKKLHAEGRLGGAANGRLGGLAITRQRINDAVLEHFRQPENQELVVKAYVSNLKSKSKRDRLAAAEAILKAEDRQIERERADRGGAIDPSGMTQEELQAFVEQGLTAMIERGEFPADIVIDEAS